MLFWCWLFLWYSKLNTLYQLCHCSTGHEFMTSHKIISSINIIDAGRRVYIARTSLLQLTYVGRYEWWNFVPMWVSVQGIKPPQISGNSKGLWSCGVEMLQKLSITWKSVKTDIKWQFLVEVNPPVRKLKLLSSLVTLEITQEVPLQPISCMPSENWPEMDQMMSFSGNNSTFRK